MVLRERIELSTSPLPRECSTTELPQRRVMGRLDNGRAARKGDRAIFRGSARGRARALLDCGRDRR